VHNGAVAGSTFIQPIVDTTSSPASYKGDLVVKANGYDVMPQPVTLTLIMNASGKVHAYSGILPVTSANLPAHEVENFLKKMLVNFETGPIITDDEVMRSPQPVSAQMSWAWLQQVGRDWITSDIVDSNDAARFPLQSPSVREGWLQAKKVTPEK
jgi:hypothetical protein